MTAPSYQGLVNNAAKRLHQDSDTARIDAEVLLQHTVGQSLAWLIAYGDQTATPEHIKNFYHLVEQRQRGQPIAYLTGHKEFWSLDLLVSPAVLIPRPDTEILVEQALTRLPIDQKLNVLDLGTGSGAIALAIGKERPNAQVLAVDINTDALAIAKHNADKHKLNNVSFLQSSWYTAINNKKFNLITSNPPYIEHNDAHLNKGDLRYEPSTALVGSDSDGLGDIREIINKAPSYLNHNGYLLIEHGFNQAESVQEILSKAGFKQIENYRDLNNLPRCSVARPPC